MTDYESKYKEAVEKLRSLYDNYEQVSNLINLKEELEEIFPELKESDGARAKREIIDFLKCCCEKEVVKAIDAANWIAWLELQGEQKPDKVEPKFKAGDWCIDNEDGTIFQIVKVLNNTYTYKTNEGKEYFCTHYSLENDARFWTIQDAKDGDVLATFAGAFIYNGNNGGGSCPGSYCGIDTSGGFKTGVEHHWSVKKVYPATKEQRDLLFQKMKEAGYKWDAEKKELKKIEDGSAWSEGDEAKLSRIYSVLRETASEHAFMTQKRIIGDKECVELQGFLKSLKDRVRPQKKEWSEEDRGNLLDVKCIIDEVWHNQYVREEIERSGEELESLWHWLNKLWQRVEYPQSTWKPSDAQMASITCAVRKMKESACYDSELVSLYQELKKLREE